MASTPVQMPARLREKLLELLEENLQQSKDKGRSSRADLAFEFLETFRNVCEDNGSAELPDELAERYGVEDLHASPLFDQLQKAAPRPLAFVQQFEKAVPIEWSRTGGKPELDVALRARLEASILTALESAMLEATPVADVIPAVLAAIDRWARGAKLLAKQLALGKRRSSDMTLREHVTLVLRKWAVDRPPFEWRKHGIEPTDAMRGVRNVRPIVPRSSGLARYLLVILEQHSGFRWADGDDPHWRTTVGGAPPTGV
ncbi:MAG: hypothetical protein JWO36_2659 [Myxococcales bacterium]|nr:hypothetical protein [Myxococcales bacterium]